jgi:hypothetical protein
MRNAEWTHEFHEFSRIVRVTAAWGWAAPFGGSAIQNTSIFISDSFSQKHLQLSAAHLRQLLT